MFAKLAVRNVRRSFRDYGVYLLTLTFGVCLFYAFNSLDGQGAMIYLARTKNPVVESIYVLMDVFSVFVAVVLACLILYANRFLLRRRKRELGTYLLLGLSQGQVSRLLFLETGLIGLISLALGLVLGVAASCGMSALTLSMFETDMSGMLAVSFSWRAAGKTCLYFGVIFLIVMAFSGVQVSRSRLIDLLHGERKNEELKPRPLRVAVLQLAAGVVCLLAAYAILLIFGMAIAVAVLPICIPMLSLGTAGTLLIFRSLSGFVMKYAQEHPKFYFKGLNMFTLRQWISKVHTTYLAQTVICILLLLAVGITASSMGLNNAINANAADASPLDVSVQDTSEDAGARSISAQLRQLGFDPDTEMAKSWEFMLYYLYDHLTPALEEHPELAEFSTAMAASDYNALRALNGLSPRVLTGPEPYKEHLYNGGDGLIIAVLPDEMIARLELPVRRQIWAGNYAGNREETEARFQAARKLLYQQPGAYSARTYLEDYLDMMGNKILALFLGLYLGFTFLLSAAAVLALQQLSQAADSARRYVSLRRLGAEERQISRSAVEQVALAFLLPLGLALVHSAVGMRAANDLISSAGRVDSAQSSLVTALILLVVYGGYFLATALACRRMALKKEDQR